MTGIFTDRPIDADTKILSSQQTEIAGLDVLLELWNWEGIYGQSAILLSSQVADLSDDEIIERLRSVIVTTEDTTVSRTADGYVFINYGFKLD